MLARHIFFDIDGVLFSSTNYYAKLFQEVALELGASPSVPLSFYHENNGTKIEHWMLDLIPSHNHDKLRPLFQAKNKDDTEIHHFPLIDGVTELFQTLKQQNKTVSFVSSKSRSGINFILDQMDWHPFVDFTVAGDEVGAFKPDPEGVLKALDFFQAHPHESLFIGDSFHDFGAAQNAKVPFLGVLTGVCSAEDWEKMGAKYIPSVVEIMAAKLQ